MKSINVAIVIILTTTSIICSQALPTGMMPIVAEVDFDEPVYHDPYTGNSGLKGFGFQVGVGYQNYIGDLSGDLGAADVYMGEIFAVYHRFMGRVGTVWSGKNEVDQTFTHIHEFPVGTSMRYREYIYIEGGYLALFKSSAAINIFAGPSLNDVLDRDRVKPDRRQTKYAFDKKWGLRAGLELIYRMPGTGEDYFTLGGPFGHSTPISLGLKFWIYTPFSREGESLYGTTYNLTLTVGTMMLSRH